LHQQLWGYKVEWRSVSRGTGEKKVEYHCSRPWLCKGQDTSSVKLVHTLFTAETCHGIHLRPTASALENLLSIYNADMKLTTNKDFSLFPFNAPAESEPNEYLYNLTNLCMVVVVLGRTVLCYLGYKELPDEGVG
jgi:hypothetical protein